VDVYRTFAEGSEYVHDGFMNRRAKRPGPAGRVHAAGQDASRTLCGESTELLVEFGRSHFPFEATPQSSRCPICNERAGTPEPTSYALARRPRH
jgi:hypothetical protein